MTMPDLPYCDWHIHTKYLKCADATMEIAAIVKESQRAGVTQLGITDHLNSADKLPLHALIRADIEKLDAGVDVYFGVELNFTGLDGDFVLNPDIKEQYGFQFAIGGIHETYLETYDMKRIVDIQHRHHLKTCANPLVDVLVHPYWFGTYEFENKKWPWFDAMPPIPERYMRELGQAARDTGTAIEINADGIFMNPAFSKRYAEEYIAFLSIISEEGACFSVGSDAHNINHLKDVAAAWRVAEQLKLTPDRIWRPKCRPMKSAR
jgi:histidinol phosphatase-like PHP family hydrolase